MPAKKLTKKAVKEKQENEWKALGKALWFVIKTPYYVGKGIYSLGKFTNKKVEEKKVKKKREAIGAQYQDFEVVQTEIGDYKKWEQATNKSDSKIGVILGARGSGKTAFGMKFLENVHAKYNKKCYAIGFKPEEMPSWIEVVEEINDLGNNSFVLIDEGGVLFNSRSSMSSANKLLSELILIARHKNLSILFISQNSSNLEVNILRQADFLVLKPSSLLQKEFERKIIQKIYDSVAGQFDEFQDNQGIAHIYSSNFKGFVSNPLPSFWDVKISKSFR